MIVQSSVTTMMDILNKTRNMVMVNSNGHLEIDTMVIITWMRDKVMVP